jgi:hypothetical protein
MHKTNLIEAAYLPRLEFPDLDELLSMPILPLHAPFRSPHALPRRAARGMRRKQRPALDGDHSVPLRAGWRGRGCSGSRRRRGRGQILTAAVTRHTPEAAAIHRRVASNSSSPNFDPPSEFAAKPRGAPGGEFSGSNEQGVVRVGARPTRRDFFEIGRRGEDSRQNWWGREEEER